MSLSSHRAHNDGVGAEDRPDLPPLSAFGAEWDGYTIPDDAAELAAEADALRAELRDTGEQGHIRAWLRGRRFARDPRAPVTSGDRSSTFILVGAIAIVAAMFAITPLISHVHSARQLSAQPLANAHVTPGLPGGLMPDLVVTVRGENRQLRELRPAVFLFLPPGCACEATVRAVVAATSSRMVAVYLSDGPLAKNEPGQASTLSEHYSYAQALEAPPAVLDQLFGSGGAVASAVFVGADGLILSNPLPVDPLTRIESWLDRLSRTGS